MPPAMGKRKTGRAAVMPSAASGEQGESKKVWDRCPGMGKMEGAGKGYTIKDLVGTGPYRW